MTGLQRDSVFFPTRMLLGIALTLFSGKSVGQVKPGFASERLTVSAGASYSLEEDDVPASVGIHFSPQLFLTTAYTDFSVSINPSPEVLYSLSDAGEFTDKLFFQLPVMAHVNFGHLSSKDFYKFFGAFAGGGWNLQFGQSMSTSGFAWDAGIRFWLFGQSFTVMYMKLPGHEKIFSSGDFFSLNINLGKYLSQVKANNKVTDFMKPYQKKK